MVAPIEPPFLGSITGFKDRAEAFDGPVDNRVGGVVEHLPHDAVWFEAFFLANITPVFYARTTI